MNRPPRLLHIVPALLGPSGLIGGAERYALELSRALSHHAPTRLVAFGERAAQFRDGELQVRVVRNRLRGPRFAGSPLGLDLISHLRWADIIHCHQPHTMSSSLALVYARLRRKPVFATDHNGGGIALQSFVNVHAWYSGHLWVSEFARSLFPYSPRDAVIWGGVDPGRFCPDAHRARSEEALFAGRILPAKGLDHLVRAVGDDLPLAILGPVSDVRYHERLQSLAAGTRVRFLPPADDAAMLDAYRRALCLVLPSVELPGATPEVLGLVLLEAMACATPVICTRVGGMPELVRDGETGFVVSPHDPAGLRARLIWIRDHPAEARKMGEAARRRVLDRFTWEAVAQRCLAVYASLPPTATRTAAGDNTRHSSAGSISTR